LLRRPPSRAPEPARRHGRLCSTPVRRGRGRSNGDLRRSARAGPHQSQPPQNPPQKLTVQRSRSLPSVSGSHALGRTVPVLKLVRGWPSGDPAASGRSATASDKERVAGACALAGAVVARGRTTRAAAVAARTRVLITKRVVRVRLTRDGREQVARQSGQLTLPER
jgi:hypothetical protein